MGMSVAIQTETLCTPENGNEDPNSTKLESHLAPESAKSLLVQSTFLLGIDGRKYKLQRLMETWEMTEVKARNFY